jgi:hypothetical protein
VEINSERTAPIPPEPNRGRVPRVITFVADVGPEIAGRVPNR